jgi:uncharacterized RDD family membrane protein YckC
MDVTSPETATLGIWTIARFAALAVLATETLFLYAHRREPRAPRGPAGARFFWALTPAAILLGLCFWCTIFVSAARSSPGPAPAVAQLSR